MKTQKLLTGTVVRTALIGTLVKLNPLHQLKNPVMFLVYVGTLVCSAIIVGDLVGGRGFSTITFQIVLWLWFTVLFANFAESIAEAQGKARSDTLRKMRTSVTAHRIANGNRLGPQEAFAVAYSDTEQVLSAELKSGDLVVCETGDTIPGDGEVLAGIASVDESAITGESAPVIRESGGDRSSVTGGTRVISDRIVIRIANDPGNSFIDRMIAMIESAGRRKTPGEIALTILLAALSVVFLVAVITLFPLSQYIANQAGSINPVNVTYLVALLVCLIPTTIASLLSAIGISGIARLMGRNVLASSGRAVEAAGDVDVLLIDKTGTITYGNRMATALIPAPGVSAAELNRVALLSSLADETPEGRSIVDFIKREDPSVATTVGVSDGAEIVLFSARTRMSGIDFTNGAKPIRKGAIDSIREWVEEVGGKIDPVLILTGQDIARQGATPLAVAEGRHVLGIVRLSDVVKPGIRERFSRLNSLGIRTVMITGDNPLTAAAIANEAGVADYVAEARPETKLALIRQEQEAGHMVAMFGDGTNDAPALAQADVGMAMASGTQTAREAANMVDFDSDPTKLLEVVETGKQLLITRGSLTTFSLANDVAKYFAILPALFTGFYATVAASKPSVFGPLGFLNVMQLASPGSAILSAVIFNALVIIALIPLALRGVAFKPGTAASLLRRNMLIFGLGGLVVPFVGIKLIDMAVHALGWA